MPPSSETPQEKSLLEVVAEVDLYPLEAFHFVEEGLSYAIETIHGRISRDDPPDSRVSRHICGQQLCEGLRQYALSRWGLMSLVVLRQWNITSTLDFGRIVFAMIDGRRMQKTDQDSIDDFRDVYDFRTEFTAGYKIDLAPGQMGRDGASS